MALKMLLLKGKVERAKAELEKLRSKDAEFKTREAELEQALGEITEETSAEDQNVIEQQIEDFQKEKNEHEEAKGTLEREIAKIEGEMAEEEKRTAEAAKSAPADNSRKKGTGEMRTRTKFFGMTRQERDAFFAREDVKDFLQRTRELGGQKRAVSGAELLIPTVVLDLIKEKISEYSKLYKHVSVRPVTGKARQNIMGTIPEGVWTEMCASINEINLDFSGVEVDGYKVGAFVAVCNAVLQDSDIALADEIISALGKALGIALDKAILYGTGTKMPLGIVTRILQTEAPADYPTTARAWKNISATNAIPISGKTDLTLYKAFVEGTGAAKGTYSNGEKFWAMSDRTHTKMVSNALSINAAGAITAGINKEMPVVNGAIETLDFIPDGVIIGGYGDLYVLAEREGTTITPSEHARFLQDQTVFKATARYDGLPAIGEGFVIIDINGNTPTADAVTFAADTANTTEG